MLPDFGIPTTVGGVSTLAIIDDDYAAALGLVVGSAPVLTIQTSAVPAVAIGNAVVVNATNYTVVGIHPDGTGLTRLILEAA
jgi:hypothetical protein